MILYLLLITSVLGDKYAACEQIEDLDESNFNEVLATNDSVFVEFYAKWCAHSRKFAPRYGTVYEHLRNHKHIKLARVNVEQNPELAEKYSVSSYPEFKLFRKGEVINYTSDRDETNMANWIIKHSQPYVRYIKSAEELENLKASNWVCFVMMGSEDSEQFSIFLQAAKQSKGTCYGLIQDKGVFNYETKSEACILVFKQDYEKFQVNVRFEGLVEYFNQHQVPWVLPLSDQAIEEVFEKGKTGLFVFSKDGNVKDTLNLLTADTYNFVQLAYGDLTSAQHLVLASELGISGKEMPFALIVDSNMRKFLYEGEISIGTLKQFYHKFKSGEAEVFYKSEELKTDDGELVRFVGNGFADEVAKVRTLVAFVIPNCGYCRILRPELEILARESDVRVGYVDLSRNDLPGFAVDMFPTVALFSPDVPSGQFYTGELTAKHIQEYFFLEKSS